MTKYEERWIKLLEKIGYTWTFDKFQYWDNVLYAIHPKGKRFPIAHVESKNGVGYIVNQNDIKVSLRNLQILEKYNSLQYPEDYYLFDIIKDLSVR